MRRGGGLVLPAVAVVAVLLVAPLLLVGDESLRLFVPGRVGSVHDAPLTLQNYAELLRPAYARYFADTFRISLIATLVALVLAYPIGYRVAREARPRVRRAWIAFLVVMLFPIYWMVSTALKISGRLRQFSSSSTKCFPSRSTVSRYSLKPAGSA